jgi:hypothetical protein
MELRMPGVDTYQLRELVSSNVDTGSLRRWCFECAVRPASGD